MSDLEREKLAQGKLRPARNFVLGRRTTDAKPPVAAPPAQYDIGWARRSYGCGMEPYDSQEKVKVTAGAVAAVVMTAMPFVILFAVLIAA
ncbi:hypothetical protein [Bradyrhizobium genosp. P]|uniref:hypothetical protein n=1 Tax=Bradyrhizobium genosp. P TaxID=83641 RepID=UPI003CF0711F